tara:strand:+ start:4178 stop:4801 length:624 start_codon:yes stop_codon:yes gene_type:complete
MEQELINSLIVESIKIYGHDVYFINRNVGDVDAILNTADLPTFDGAWMVEMYIKNIEGFDGDGDFLAKFGLEIRDQITFTVAKTVYEKDIAPYNSKNVPQLGDLIYFPLNGKVFRIDFVEHESIFYQMGSLQTYDLVCSLFEYSQETFSTGITEIDTLYDSYNYTSNTSIEYLEANDPLAQNESFETNADAIVDFSEADPFSEGGRW